MAPCPWKPAPCGMWPSIVPPVVAACWGWPPAEEVCSLDTVGPVSSVVPPEPDPLLVSRCSFLLKLKSPGGMLAGSSLRANRPRTRGRVSARDLRHWYLILRLKLRWDRFSRYRWMRHRRSSGVSFEACGTGMDSTARVTAGLRHNCKRGAHLAALRPQHQVKELFARTEGAPGAKLHCALALAQRQATGSPPHIGCCGCIPLRVLLRVMLLHACTPMHLARAAEADRQCLPWVSNDALTPKGPWCEESM